MIWLLITLPPAAYLIITGYVRAWVHNNPRHNREACEDWQDFPCAISSLAWPVIIAAWLVLQVANLGAMLEAQRPVRRKQERDKAIARDEKAVYGKALPK